MFTQLVKTIETFKQHNEPPIQQSKTSSLPTKSGRDMPPTLNIPEFRIENDFFDMELTPEVFELVDITITIKQILSDSDFELNIQAGTMSMKSVFTTSNNTHLNSELNIVLGFTNTDYPAGSHKSENQL